MSPINSMLSNAKRKMEVAVRKLHVLFRFMENPQAAEDEEANTEIGLLFWHLIVDRDTDPQFLSESAEAKERQLFGLLPQRPRIEHLTNEWMEDLLESLRYQREAQRADERFFRRLHYRHVETVDLLAMV